MKFPGTRWRFTTKQLKYGEFIDSDFLPTGKKHDGP